MKTVGEVLRAERLTKNLTLHEAERATRVQLVALQALESDDFGKLPSPTAIKGFIHLYGDYLGLDQEMLLALYRRQFDEKTTEPDQILPDLAPKRSPRFMLTPGRAFGLGVAILVLGFMGYLLAQYQSFAAAPALQITSPTDQTKVNNGTIEVVGRTDRDAKLSINGQQVDLTSTGAFSVSVTLPDGTTELTFSAANKLGRVTTVKRTVIVETVASATPIGPVATSSAVTTTPAVAAAATASASPKPQLPGLTVILKIGPNPAWIKVQSDSLTFETTFIPGAVKTFTAQSQIVVTTGNAGSTDVVVNGVDQGKLGADSQVITKTYTK